MFDPFPCTFSTHFGLALQLLDSNGLLHCQIKDRIHRVGKHLLYFVREHSHKGVLNSKNITHALQPYRKNKRDTQDEIKLCAVNLKMKSDQGWMRNDG